MKVIIEVTLPKLYSKYIRQKAKKEFKSINQVIKEVCEDFFSYYTDDDFKLLDPYHRMALPVVIKDPSEKFKKYRENFRIYPSTLLRWAIEFSLMKEKYVDNNRGFGREWYSLQNEGEECW